MRAAAARGAAAELRFKLPVGLHAHAAWIAMDCEAAAARERRREAPEPRAEAAELRLSTCIPHYPSRIASPGQPCPLINYQ